MSDSRLFLLDGMALVYRAHFAFIARPIVTSYGLNTSALYGFANVLLELIKTERASHLAVVFDTQAPTERHRIFPAYKAQREEMPEDLSKALPHVKRLIEAFRIPVLTLDGYEADDIIGTLARRAEDHGLTTYMVTPDKDFAQLVTEKTFIWKPGRQGNEHEVLGVPEVCAGWGIERPDQVIDILGLWGDAVDNIPGVPGIGEKTAKALIKEFGTVDNLLASVDKLKGKQKENLTNFAEQARLSRALAAIQLDVPIDTVPESLRIGEMDREALIGLMHEFEFNTLGQRLFGADFKAGRGFERRQQQSGSDEAPDGAPAGPVTPPVLKSMADTPHDYQLAATPAARLKVLEKMQTRKAAGVYFHILGPNPREAVILGIALSLDPHKAYYLTGAGGTDLLQELAAHCAGVLLSGHDLKEALQAAVHLQVELPAVFFDTMLAQALIDTDQRYSLPWMSESLLGYTPGAPRQAEAGGQMLMAGLDDGAEQGARDIAMESADLALQLTARLRPGLVEKKLERVFYEIEAPLLPVLARMEAQGVQIDPAVLAASSVVLDKQIHGLEEAIYAAAGTRFNIASSKQLGEVLFEQLRLMEKPKKTKLGKYQTGEDILAELAEEYPIAADLLLWREASKLKSTYVDALPHSISRRTGRIHTTLLQMSTSTGRLASNNPNLQNIPIRTEQGRAIRKAFTAAPGCLLLSADYSQIELRVMASLSGDPAMIQAFKDGTDIHEATAARVYSIPQSEVTTTMRRTAKMVNFGIIFGISGFGLAQRLGIARAEALRLISEYFVQYPLVKAFMDKTIAEAGELGYVETLTGRRRYLRDITSRNATVRKAAERTAINTPIQGTAADMIKLAMIRMAKSLTASGLRCRMLLQVHDELLFELPAKELEAATVLIRHSMVEALPLNVPVVVDVGHGLSWFEAHG